jgi:hypothetical protein
MQNIQEIFGRIQKNKKKMKDLKSSYSDALKTVQEYVEINEKLKTLREKKKQIENTIRQDFTNEFQQIEDLKIDLESDQELMNDIAMTQVMKGETVSVTDEYEQSYDPIFQVKFKKAN